MQSIDGLLQGSQKACLAAFKGKLKLLSTKKKKIQQQKFKVNAEVDQLYLQLVNCSGFKEDNATYR